MALLIVGDVYTLRLKLFNQASHVTTWAVFRKVAPTSRRVSVMSRDKIIKLSIVKIRVASLMRRK